MVIHRRDFLCGIAGSLAVSTDISLMSAKHVEIVCECIHAGSQWVVFNDKPQTVFQFNLTPELQAMKVGDKLWVER